MNPESINAAFAIPAACVLWAIYLIIKYRQDKK